jgi:hypothetical protein
MTLACWHATCFCDIFVLMKAVSEHPCSFYSEDAVLVSTVATFLAPAFAERQALIAIGTPEHIAAIEDRLRSAGHDIDGARVRGQYITMDAQWALEQLTANGMPTSERFNAVLGPHIQRASEEYGSVRAFGEIVSLLWRDGKRQAALRLEELWNDALGYHPLALICGYNVRSFKNAADAQGVIGIINSHSSVIVRQTA